MKSKDIFTLVPILVISVAIPLVAGALRDSDESITKADSQYQLQRVVEIPEPPPTINSARARNVKMLNLELNSASKEELIAVNGIGNVLSSRIVEYRDALGGFHSIEQLQEVSGIDQSVYTKIFGNFYIKDGPFSKISINFATQNELESHPYITKSMAKRIETARKRGGYFTNYQEIIDRDILLPEEAQRVAPYLLF